MRRIPAAPLIGATYETHLHGFDVHDLVAHGGKRTRLESFSEEISIVVHSTDKRNVKLEGFHHISNVKMTPGHVFGPVMQLRIIRKVMSGFIVGAEHSRPPELLARHTINEFAKVDYVLRSF